MEIQSAVDLLSKVAMALIVIGTVGFLVWKRTRSTHSLMARLWRLFYGNKECRDPTIQKFLDEQAALMEFCFTTGVRVRTQKQAHAVIAWARQHEESIVDIAACGPYFDFDRMTLKENKLPGKQSLISLIILTCILALGGILFGIGITSDKALLQMKESGVRFTLSVDYAKPLLSRQGLSKAQCQHEKAPQTGSFSREDARIICQIFQATELTSYLRKTVKDQRIAFGLAFLFLAGCSWVSLGWLTQGIQALDMRKRIAQRDRQLRLDLAGHDESAST